LKKKSVILVGKTFIMLFGVDKENIQKVRNLLQQLYELCVRWFNRVILI